MLQSAGALSECSIRNDNNKRIISQNGAIQPLVKMLKSPVQHPSHRMVWFGCLAAAPHPPPASIIRASARVLLCGIVVSVCFSLLWPLSTPASLSAIR